MTTREDIRERMAEDGVQYLLAQFVDLHGSAKVKLVPAGNLDALIDDGAAFAGAALPGLGQGPGFLYAGPLDRWHRPLRQ